MLLKGKLEDGLENGQDGELGELGEEWKRIEKSIKEALSETERKKNGEKGREIKKGQWNEDCVKKKIEVRKELKELRKGKANGEEYRKLKQVYKELCNIKKEEESIRWEKKAEKAKREGEIWEIVNRERKKAKRIDEGIERKVWKEYFMRLLEEQRKQ